MIKTKSEIELVGRYCFMIETDTSCDAIILKQVIFSINMQDCVAFFRTVRIIKKIISKNFL